MYSACWLLLAWILLATGTGPIELERVERVSPRALLLLLFGGIASYVLIHQLTDVGSVDCPPTPSLSFEKGATFDCTVVVAGEERTVEVSVLNEEGGIQVSEPK